MKALAMAAAILKSSSLRIMLQPQWTILKALGLLPLSSKNAHHSSSLAFVGVLLVQEAEEKKKANYKLPHNVLKDPTAER